MSDLFYEFYYYKKRSENYFKGRATHSSISNNIGIYTLIKSHKFKDFQWQLVKLKDDNVETDKLNIFVETKFIEASENQTNGFWAIDDVRVCHENGNLFIEL